MDTSLSIDELRRRGLTPPKLTLQAGTDLIGKKVCYCPNCGWYIYGATNECPECGHGKLRIWEVD